MRKIKIFLASSIVEFSQERMAIENFLRNISDKFEEHYNVKIQPLLCENFDDVYTRERKQEEYNSIIRGCEYCFFIFFTKIGQYTREEFEVARKQFETTGNPKIYVYFKNVEDGNVEQGVLNFMDELDKIFGHYYGSFSHIDTVKLRILLSLKLREMDFLEVKAEGGKCIVDGRPVMSLEYVSEFSNNKQLEQLVQKLHSVEEEYYRLRVVYEKRNGSQEEYSRYIQVASLRQTLIDEIEELQGLIFNVSMRLIQDDLRGEITPRQKEAYRLFELGDYEGCMSVLNAQDIDSDFHRRRMQLKEQETALSRKYIREHKTAIEILTSMKNYPERFSEIESRYQKILPVIVETAVEIDTALEYIYYLIEHNMDYAALEVTEKLLVICDEPSNEQRRLFTSMAIIYEHQHQYGKAEEFYLKAMEIGEVLAKNKPTQFRVDLATSYSNISTFYHEQGNSVKAEESYLKALSIMEEEVKENQEEHADGLAALYNNLGTFYMDKTQYTKAEVFLLKAVAINEKLEKEKPELHRASLARNYNNLGRFYRSTGDVNKAEEFYLKSIEIKEVLVKENPKRFGGDLVKSYTNTGVFYGMRGIYAKADEFLLKAVEITETLAIENPVRFSRGLAGCYNNIGLFYIEQGRYEEAEESYWKALEIRETLAKENPNRFNRDLASSYKNFGIFFEKQGQNAKAEEFYLKYIELQEVVAKENPDSVDDDLAIDYANIGVFFERQGQYAKAEQFLQKAIAMHEVLAKNDPDMYTGSLAASCFNYAQFLRNSKWYNRLFKRNNEWFDKAHSLARTQPDNPMCKEILEAMGD